MSEVKAAMRRGPYRIRDVTDRQRAVLAVIALLIRQRGIPPTIREIREVLKLSSLRGVTLHLDSLALKGCLARDYHCPRSITITAKGHAEIAKLRLSEAAEGAANAEVLSHLQAAFARRSERRG